MSIDTLALIAEAHKWAGFHKCSDDLSVGGVGAAVLSESGEIFTGSCIDAACGIGFCAEHSALAQMLKHHQTRIVAVVAVSNKGHPIPPCGRCRELMYQINPQNLDAQVVLSADGAVPLRVLLPFNWQSSP